MNHLPFILAQAAPVDDAPADPGPAIPTSVEGGKELINTMIEWLSQYGVSFLINLVGAIAVYLIGKWLAKILTRVAEKLLKKSDVDETLIKFLCNLIYAVLMVLVILAALGQLGVNTTSFAAIIAAAGLAVGFALQGSLANFAAGVMLILFKPFKVGDFIVAGGETGTVEEIQIFCTMMRTGDNVSIIIPNAAVTGGTITNFSAKDTRRIDLVIGCGYGDNLKDVKQYLEEVVVGDERILKDPEPVVAVAELGDSSVNFVVRPWVNSSDYWGTKWDLLEKIKTEFAEKGFNIPYPTQDVHIHNAG